MINDNQHIRSNNQTFRCATEMQILSGELKFSERDINFMFFQSNAVENRRNGYSIDTRYRYTSKLRRL